MKGIKNIMDGWFQQIVINFWSFITGFVGSILALFLPIKNIVNTMILFFIIDSIVGYLNARITRKERFSKSKIFETTIPRILLSVLIVMIVFLWEKTFYQIGGNAYKIVGGFISGILILSIIQNAYEITNWGVFKILVNYLKEKFILGDENKKNTTN